MPTSDHLPIQLNDYISKGKTLFSNHTTLPDEPFVGVVVLWYTLLSTLPPWPAYLPMVIFTRSLRRRIHLMGRMEGSGRAAGEG